MNPAHPIRLVPLTLLPIAAPPALAADPPAELGRPIFFDATLSDPAGQCCATCHSPAVGWSGPDSPINEAEAAIVAFMKTLNDGWMPLPE